MADLSIEFAGIKSPNPFWLASAPPTDKAYNVNRAVEAGWGGVVWKTVKELGVITKESSFLTAKTSAMVCWLFVGSGIFAAAFALLERLAAILQDNALRLYPPRPPLD